MKLRVSLLAVTVALLCLFSCPASAAQHTVKVQWTPPLVSAGITITGYKIYRGTSQGTEGITAFAVVTGNVTTFTDTNVTAGSTYFYMLTTTYSCDATVVDCTGLSGESVKSAEFQTDKAIPLNPAVAPGAPSAATAVVQ